MPPNTRRELRVDGIAEPISHFTDAVVFGDVVYVSGCIGADANGVITAPDDVVAQARKTLENMGLILAAAGTGFENVLKVTVYLTSIADRAAVNTIRQEFFGDARPASTLVEISKLVRPDAKVEIEAIASIPSPA